jgi:hypothetical protein
VLRYLFSRYVPPFTRVLLVESGSRGVFDRIIPRLYEVHGEAMELDLVTCHESTPEGVRGKIYRVQDHSGPAARGRLYRELAARQYSVVGILCSNVPIMTKWKWALAARLRSKVFVVNEFADVLWLDWGHRRNIAEFMRVRMGFSGSAVVPSLARLFLFPLALAYLLLFAAVVHTRRRIRIS